MYNYIVTLIGTLPSNLEWVYGVLVILLCILFFLILLCPAIAVFGILKRNKRRY